MKEKIITIDGLKEFVNRLLKEGNIVVAPDEEESRYIEIKSADKLNLNPKSAPTTVSIKEFILPRTEPLFFYKQKKTEVDLIDPPTINKKTVIVGVKPCDAGSINILSKVFNWDFEDDFFNNRVQNTIIIGMSCQYLDEHCFCISVNLSPIAEEGADLFLIPLDEKTYALRIVTPKGEEFIKPFENLLKEGNPEKSKEIEKAIKQPSKIFDETQLREWVTNNFENKYWDEPGNICLGCGRCAFICPTCHCFDIVDEELNSYCGRRMKNWDACQFCLFTLHASGHNPRDKQSKRSRQRISHKFKYYYDKFGKILCTGCGRCARGCPVSINIVQMLTDINSMIRL